MLIWTRTLNEARSEPLYHGTPYRNAIKILQNNELQANVAHEGETLDVSFTRNKTEAYRDVCFALDQEKLSYNYKLRPYLHGADERDLAEERTNRTIKNLDRYLLGMDLSSPRSLGVLRRKLASNFGDHGYVLDETRPAKHFDNRTPHDLYELLKIIHKKKIPMGKLLKEAESYLDKFLKDIPDEEYMKKIKSSSRRKTNESYYFD